jgi:hypothetical protein
MFHLVWYWNRTVENRKISCRLYNCSGKIKARSVKKLKAKEESRKTEGAIADASKG